MQLPVKDLEGKELRTIQVDDYVFGIEPNVAVLHQAFVAGRNAQRRGSASTLTRGEVQGSTRKIRMQKYTGRARQGSIRAPHHRGGGITFGPKPRDYSQRLPKKMRRLAIRSALSGKAADGQIRVVEGLAFDQPKTKEMERILVNLGAERSALIVTGQPNRQVFLAARNLPRRKVIPADYLNVVDMMVHRDLVMTEEAVRRAEALWGVAGETAPAPEAAAPRAPRRTRTAAPAEEAPAPARRRRSPAKAEAPAPPARPRRARATIQPEAEADE